MKRNRHIGFECRDGFDVGRDPCTMSTDDRIWTAEDVADHLE